jgi:hypothetical protein
MNLTKQQAECYKQCHGNCRICLIDGACDLQTRINTVNKMDNSWPVNYDNDNRPHKYRPNEC